MLLGDSAAGGDWQLWWQVCLSKRVQLEPPPMRVAGWELVVIRLKAAPASNGTGSKGPAGEKVRDDAPAANNGTEPHPRR